MNVLFLIQARLGSSRFKHKMIQNVYEDLTVIDFVVRRLWLSDYANDENVFVLTTKSREDDFLAMHLKAKCMPYYRGNEHDVHRRFTDFLKDHPCDFFVRICGDNPCIEPGFIDELLNRMPRDTDYASYFDHKTKKPAMLTHYGFFAEVVNTKSFLETEISSQYEREHVTPMFYSERGFNTFYIKMPHIVTSKDYRFTIDTEADYEYIKSLLKRLDRIEFRYTDLFPLVDESMLKTMRAEIRGNVKGE